MEIVYQNSCNKNHNPYFSIFRGIEACTEGVVNLDSKKIVQNLHKVTGLAVFAEKVGYAVVSNSTAPVYRNGVLSHVKTLKNVSLQGISLEH